MSKRIRLGLLLGLVLLGLAVVTIWYGQRQRSELADSGSGSALENNLTVGHDTVPERAPTEDENAAAANSPRAAGDDDVGTRERAKSEPAAVPAKAAASPASKRKNKTAEETRPAAEEAASPQNTPPPPPQPPPPAVQNGILIGRHHNAIGASLHLAKITYLLDGQVVATEEGGKLDQTRDFEAFNRRTTPGEHTITAIAEFQGNGHGVFSYFDAYRYKARSDHRVTVRESGTTTVTISLYERSGPLVAIENRLAIGFRVN